MSPYCDELVSVSSETTKDSWWKGVEKSDFRQYGEIEKLIEKQRWEESEKRREEKRREEKRREEKRKNQTKEDAGTQKGRKTLCFVQQTVNYTTTFH